MSLFKRIMTVQFFRSYKIFAYILYIVNLSLIIINHVSKFNLLNSGKISSFMANSQAWALKNKAFQIKEPHQTLFQPGLARDGPRGNKRFFFFFFCWNEDKPVNSFPRENAAIRHPFMMKRLLTKGKEVTCNYRELLLLKSYTPLWSTWIALKYKVYLVLSRLCSVLEPATLF